LRAQISKEAKAQQDLKRERDQALTEASEFKAAVEERDKALQSQIAKQADIEQGLKTERDRAVAAVGELKTTIEGLSRIGPDGRSIKEQTKRWFTPISVAIVLLAAAASAALVSWSPGSKTDGEADAKAVQTTGALAKSEQARQAAEAKVDAAVTALDQSEQARQAAETKASQATAALAKSEQSRQAAEAKAADAERAQQAAVAKANDADKARQAAVAKANDADKARQGAEAKAEELAAQLKTQKPTTNPSQSTSNRTGPAVTGVDWNKGCLIC
jgi:colicin import membrane protein